MSRLKFLEDARDGDPMDRCKVRGCPLEVSLWHPGVWAAVWGPDGSRRRDVESNLKILFYGRSPDERVAREVAAYLRWEYGGE